MSIRELFGTDIGLCTTSEHDVGNPGPDGETFLGITDPGVTVVDRVRLPGDKERARQCSVISLLNSLRLRLTKTV